MHYPDEYVDILALYRKYAGAPWHTAPETARLLQWSDRKARYWLEKMVTDRIVIWRFHPGRYGWHTTKQYALPRLAK